MHVLYVIGGKGLRYGAEVVALNLIENLIKEYGVQFTIVINAKGVISELCEKLNIEYYVVNYRPYVYAKINNRCIDCLKRNFLLLRACIEDEIAIKQLEKQIDFSKIDIIHTNLSRNMLGVRLAKKHDIPHVWHIQEMFNAHYKLNFLMSRQLSFMNKFSDVFVGISHTVTNDWINNGLDERKTHTVLNGIREKQVFQRHSSKLYRIIMIAELTPAKGQEFVVDALSKLSSDEKNEITLDFVGGGTKEYVDFLKDEVNQKGLSNMVKFLGFRDDASDMLSDYDILINASDGEGFGLSTADAMMNGVCPLVSDRGANLELIDDRVTGVVFRKNEGDKSFIYALRYLMNDMVINQISSNAHEYAMNNFTIKRQVREMFDLYQLLSDRMND